MVDKIECKVHAKDVTYCEPHKAFFPAPYPAPGSEKCGAVLLEELKETRGLFEESVRQTLESLAQFKRLHAELEPIVETRNRLASEVERLKRELVRGFAREDAFRKDIDALAARIESMEQAAIERGERKG